ncbi:MAG: amino acid adenylation protein, partial [Burkholderiales bacterium]|nr:amino acid adenylation protein [Burkholderiales bacterium]
MKEKSLNSKNIFISLYELFGLGIKIWLEDQKIKVLLPTGVVLSDDMKQFIKKYKVSIVDILNDNKVFSSLDVLPILKTNLKKSPLSPAQERLWFIDQYESFNAIYNVTVAMRVSKTADKQKIRKSLYKVMDRHHALRSIIKINEDDMPYQLVQDEYQNLQIFSYATRTFEEMDKLIKKEFIKPIDLEHEYPVRLAFFDVLSDCGDITESYMTIVMHHIVTDWWSMKVFFNDLEKAYLGQKLETLPIQYLDYAIWARQSIHINKKTLDFWKKYLTGYEQLYLYMDRERPRELDYKGANIQVSLNTDLSERVRCLAKTLHVSLYSYLLSSFYLLLNIYSNQEDFVIGTVMANRQEAQLEELIGVFVNTIILRCKMVLTDGLLNFVKEVSGNIINIQAYQNIPFEKIVDMFVESKDPGRNPIFQIMFFTEDISSSTSDNMFIPCKKYMSSDFAKFDLTVSWHDDGDNLSCNFNYRTSLFEQSTIEGYMQTYIKIIERMVEF